MIMEFVVKSRSKHETSDGTTWKVTLKSRAGLQKATLTITSETPEIFVGFPLNERLPVEIKKLKTLETTPVEER